VQELWYITLVYRYLFSDQRNVSINRLSCGLMSLFLWILLAMTHSGPPLFKKRSPRWFRGSSAASFWIAGGCRTGLSLGIGAVCTAFSTGAQQPLEYPISLRPRRMNTSRSTITPHLWTLRILGDTKIATLFLHKIWEGYL
jgi:hypothetical protein